MKFNIIDDDWLRHDSKYAICPSCGYKHGDCWEWLVDELSPEYFECEGCGKKLKAWPEYEATYFCELEEA